MPCHSPSRAHARSHRKGPYRRGRRRVQGGQTPSGQVPSSSAKTLRGSGASVKGRRNSCAKQQGTRTHAQTRSRSPPTQTNRLIARRGDHHEWHLRRLDFGRVAAYPIQRLYLTVSLLSLRRVLPLQPARNLYGQR